MSSMTRSLLACAIALSLSSPVFAQPKGDAGSGPTSGATSTNDAGSGPTKGAKLNSGSTTANASNHSAGNNASANSAGVTPGPKSTGGSQPVTPATPKKQ
jgi:hypothetical protein